MAVLFVVSSCLSFLSSYLSHSLDSIGLQRGLQSFTKSTAMEAIKLGTKLAVGTQVLLEHADDILSFDAAASSSTAVPGAAAMARQSSLGHSQWRENGDDDDTHHATGSQHGLDRATGAPLPTTTTTLTVTGQREGAGSSLASKYGEQPTSFNEGIEFAYDSMRRNVGTAAHTIFAVPMEVYEKTGTHVGQSGSLRILVIIVICNNRDRSRRSSELSRWRYFDP